MYKIAVIGDYDSIYGFATLGLSICPVRSKEEAEAKIRQFASGKYGIIYITEAVAAELKDVIEEYKDGHCLRLFRYRGYPVILAQVWKV